MNRSGWLSSLFWKRVDRWAFGFEAASQKWDAARKSQLRSSAEPAVSDKSREAK